MPKSSEKTAGKRKAAKRKREAADANEAAPEVELDEGRILRVHREVGKDTKKG